MVVRNFHIHRIFAMPAEANPPLAIARLPPRDWLCYHLPHADFLERNPPQRDPVFTRLDGREKRARRIPFRICEKLTALLRPAAKARRTRRGGEGKFKP
jgi:hypothetical protein